MEHICPQCGKTFERASRAAKFCTRRCYELSKRKLSEAETEEVLARYLAGESSITICGDFGVCHTTVLNVVHRAGKRARKNTDYRHFTLRENAFDEIADEETAYWLGFIYADGYVRVDGVTLRLKPSDRGHVEKFLAFMGSNVKVKDCKSYAGDTVFASCHSYRLAVRLTELGIIPERGEFAKTVGVVPPDLHHAFIRGMIDGDGYITRSDTKYTANIGLCGKEEAVEWVRHILVKRAGASQKPRPRRRRDGDCYEIAFGGRFQVGRLADWLYQGATVYLDRKKQLADYWRTAR